MLASLPGVEPTPSELEGKVLTIGPPGNPRGCVFSTTYQSRWLDIVSHPPTNTQDS